MTLRVPRRYSETEQLASHLRMTHRQYVGDIKAQRKSKAGPAVTVREQLSECHQALHADIREGHPSHGTVPHEHVL